MHLVFCTFTFFHYLVLFFFRTPRIGPGNESVWRSLVGYLHPIVSTMASSYAEQPSNDEDGTFDLYDLRVEVVCPPGARILCGASAGDYFTLQGELLYLPPGQGFSIYSIGT